MQDSPGLSRTDTGQRLSIALAAVGIGTWEWTWGEPELQRNPASERHFGFAPGEFTGTIAEAEKRVIAEDLPGIRAEILRALSSRSPFQLEFRVHWPNGTIHWLSASGSVVQAASGDPVRLTGVIFDMTERRNVEVELQESEMRQRHLADLMPQMVWITDASSRIEYINRRWYEYTGIAVGTLGAEAWRPVVHPEDCVRVFAAQAESLQHHAPFEIEYRIRRHDGHYRWHLARTVFVAGFDGRPEKRFGTATDIHDQKFAEDRQRFFAAVSDSLACAIEWKERVDRATRVAVDYLGGGCVVYLKQPDGRISLEAVAHRDQECQAIALEIHRLHPLRIEDGSTPDLAIRTGRSTWIPQVSQDPHHRNLLAEIGTRSLITIPLGTERERFGAITIVSQDRELTRADLDTVEEFARRIALALYNSLLYRTQVDSVRQLRQAVEARDDFLSIASHELKTPLTSLKLQIQLRKRLLLRSSVDAFQPEKLREMFESDSRQIERLNRLIDDMLDVARINTGKLSLICEPFDLRELVMDSSARLRGTLENVGCTLNVTALDSIHGTWDRFRIEQVLTNLLTNAMRYGSGKPVQIRLTRESGNALIQVQDDGIGIAPDDQARIFDRFERVSSGTGPSGLGLGLFISRQIVEAHHGTIRVVSEKGCGSTFEVLLPIGPLKHADCTSKVHEDR